MVASTSASATSITVFGATGNQGGSVIDHLLASSKPYKIRGVTRNPSSPAGKALTEKGVEVVKGDIESEEEVEKAVQGVDLVFGLTLSDYSAGYDKEYADGKRLVDAVKKAGTKMLYFSGLPNTKKGSDGKYYCYTFDVKAHVFEYALSVGVPTVSVEPCAFMENLVTFSAPRKGPDGSYVFASAMDPTHPRPWLHCRKDYGAFVVGAIEKDVPSGERILAVSHDVPEGQVSEILSKYSGTKVEYYHVPRDQWLQLVGETFAQMTFWINDFGYYGSEDWKTSQHVVSGRLDTIEDFVKNADWSKVLV